MFSCARVLLLVGSMEQHLLISDALPALQSTLRLTSTQIRAFELADDVNQTEIQNRYLNLLIENGGYKVKWGFELFGKRYIWLVSPSGQWIGERWPESEVPVE